MATTLTRPAPSALDRLVDDYLIHCEARGLSPRTLTNNYGYALRDVFLPWCREQGIAEVRDLDGRTVDRFTSALLHRERNGRPISKHTVHSYIRPVRQLLTWAARARVRRYGRSHSSRCAPGRSGTCSAGTRSTCWRRRWTASGTS